MDYFLFLKSVLDYIENRVAEEMSADEVAAAAGFSPAHLREIFRNATGQTLSRYMTRRRLSHAASELARTRRTVAEIAYNYGFGSHDAFTRAFRREFGETPSAFRAHRRGVRGTLIVPGVFGPAVAPHLSPGMKKEDHEIMSDRSDRVDGDQGTLYGVVPKVAYTMEECTPFPSCLRACLAYLGQDVSYARLMAASGAAFRLRWNLDYWDGGNVDIRCIMEDATEPLRRAFWAAGRDFRLLAKPGREGQGMAERAPKNDERVATGGKDEFITLIRREIDAGRPVIGFGIIGPPEACIIAGYRDGGETLVGWNFFQEMPEFAGAIAKEPCGYFRRQGWYEHPETVALMAIGEPVAPLDEHDFLRETLSFGLAVMETPKIHTYAGGPAAYEAWASALLRESDFPPDAPLPMLMERLMCQCDAETMVGEGRAYAAAFMQEEAEAFPAAAEPLLAAADCCRREWKLVEEMVGIRGGFAMGEKNARVLARPEVRRDLAALIRRCAEADREAAGKIREALGKL